MKYTAKSMRALQALTTLSLLDSTTQAACSDADREAFSIMANAMVNVGGDFLWSSYKVVTQDDYVLTMFKIEGDASGNRIHNHGSKGPVLLQHGFLTDSITWFTGLSDENELAVGPQLFLEGYDVWFGNIRGSRNSREHLNQDADDDNDRYWNFSYPECGTIDLPAMLVNIKDN